MIPAGFMPGPGWGGFSNTTTAPCGATGSSLLSMMGAGQEVERVKLRRKTGFWTWAEVLKDAAEFDCSEEAFYRRANRPELCVHPGRRLRFQRGRDSTEMFEV